MTSVFTTTINKMSMLTLEAQSKFRPRRRHRKSRNGCAECKRRRIKCDEIKPSCSRCILTMQKCIYASTSPTQPATTDQGSQLSLSLPTPSPRSGSPSPPFEVSQLSLSPAHPHPDLDTSDTALYHHYLHHTSRTLTDNRRDHHAIQICLPTLALRSRTVYHSILALSAACMCCDLIYKDPAPDVATVIDILMTGYRHYNLASERLRELISRPSAANAEPLLAAPPLLVPFVTSSQQVNHWISNRTSEPFHGQKRLNSTPRDVIVISRGISATIRALSSHSHSPASSPSACACACGYPQLPTPTPDPLDSMDDYADPIPSSPTLALPPSHTHPMYHLIKSTSSAAFTKLHHRITSAAFYTPPTRPSTPSPDEPMTRPLLSFLVHAPSTYLDFVLPLLDRRLERPAETPTLDKPKRGQIELDLNVEQTLALDIYAHWSVLMILVGEESWWIGKLPDITLGGMVAAFGDDFVGRIWGSAGERAGAGAGAGAPAEGEGEGEWWPRSMLRIEREIGRYR
ncbi:Zn(II)2Cys6 transcription factor domain-containing protein [Aspergillus mulundensis]|uniref:Zn(2)-C6 fungal-type domain-containing protein n=1 Tax=Aspergillus mulundensis TaxID=1810919 RepID=A0A3D8QJF6_9EURO|nr:hypothetical protein DSM5745_10482 [Aspergillus mulundensis]RDW61810.1 hypothetical protein DSM5745_10482 [Aspergillus mulundensis]